MNKTFKVVFNRARGALMVANEVTSSVQKKGTKAVLATAALALISASAMAGDEVHYNYKTWSSSSAVSTVNATFDGNYLVDKVEGYDPKSNTEYYVVGLSVDKGVEGENKNVSVTLTGKTPRVATETIPAASTEASDFSLIGIQVLNSSDGGDAQQTYVQKTEPTFSGDFLNISIESDLIGGLLKESNNDIDCVDLLAIRAEGVTRIGAKKVDIKVKATNEEGYLEVNGIKDRTTIFITSNDVNFDIEGSSKSIYKDAPKNRVTHYAAGINVREATLEAKAKNLEGSSFTMNVKEPMTSGGILVNERSTANITNYETITINTTTTDNVNAYAVYVEGSGGTVKLEGKNITLNGRVYYESQDNSSENYQENPLNQFKIDATDTFNVTTNFTGSSASLHTEADGDEYNYSALYFGENSTANIKAGKANIQATSTTTDTVTLCGLDAKEANEVVLIAKNADISAKSAASSKTDKDAEESLVVAVAIDTKKFVAKSVDDTETNYAEGSVLNISSESTGNSGAVGIYIDDGSDAKFKYENTNITVKNGATADSDYGQALMVARDTDDTSAPSVLFTGNLKTTTTSGKSSAIGIMTNYMDEDEQKTPTDAITSIVVNGNTVIESTADGEGIARGIALLSKSKLRLKGDVTITTTGLGDKTSAIAFEAQDSGTESTVESSDNTTYVNKQVKIGTNDKAVTITATAKNANNAKALYLHDGGKVKIVGKDVTVTGAIELGEGDNELHVIAKEKGIVTGNINVLSTKDDSRALFDLGDGSTVTGNITVSGNSSNIVKLNATGEKKNLTFTGNISASNGGNVHLSGGKHSVGTLTLDKDSALVLDGSKVTLSNATENAAITMEGESELVTTLAVAFKDIVKNANDIVTNAAKRLSITVAESSEATLTISDTFTILTDTYDTLQNLYSGVKLCLANSLYAVEEKLEVTEDRTFGQLDGKEATVSVVNGKTLKLSGEGKTSEIKTLNLETEDTSATSVATFKMDKTTAKIGEIKGNGKAAVHVEEGSDLQIGTLTGSMEISVGNHDGKGAKLSVDKLRMNGGMIFVDPLYGHSVLRVGELPETGLNTAVVGGNGSFVIFGATEDAANSALSKVSGLSSIEALAYVATPLTIGTNGVLYVDPARSSAPSVTGGTVNIASGAALVIDQVAIGSANVISGATSVTVASDATIAVVNAVAGSTLSLVEISDGVTTSISDETAVLTDSPFVTGALSGSTGKITLSENADETGIDVIASAGVQSMIRRADAVLAETIADRAAAGESGLWVSVRGERYKQSHVGSGYKADVGYGAFGADFAPTEGTRLGVALQYGHGKVKGDAYSVKNKMKDYSATLYGSALLGDTGIKLLGEVAYTKSENDITNTYYTGLNQDLDAKMYSGGLTAQKSFSLGSFEVMPSIGVRVSRIETDAMKAGANSIAKQKQTLVQVPVAVRLNSKTIETGSGWNVTPRFKVAYIPTFGDKEIEVFGKKSTVIDTSPVQGSLGVNFTKGNFAFDAAANLGAGKSGTKTIGAKVGMTYRF